MIKKMILAFSLTVLSLYAAETVKDKYRMFPEAEEGYTRYIVDLPKTDNDNDYKIELLIGKSMMVDCNYHSFSGKIEKFPLKGWGYNYYRVTNIQSGPTTMMVCREPKREAFITVYLPQEMQLIRYNSRLGTVIYVPEDFEVRYRIWSVKQPVLKAQKR
jgi:ecotin